MVWAFEMLVVNSSFSLIASSLFSIHITGTDNQSRIIAFVNKKHNQISACICGSGSGIQIFASSGTFFYKIVTRSIKEDIFDFVLRQAMLDSNFIDDVWQPDKIINIHDAPSRHVPVSRDTETPGTETLNYCMATVTMPTSLSTAGAIRAKNDLG